MERGSDRPVRAYLLARRRSVGMWALFTVLSGVVAALYRLPAEPVLYAAGLCALAGAFAMGADYVRYRRQRRDRLAAERGLPALSGPLPPAAGPGEEDFRAMAEKMRRAYGALMTEEETARREMLDWYTAWVHQIKAPIAAMQMTIQGEDTPEHRALEGELFRVRQYAEMALCYLRLDGSPTDLVIRACSLDGIIRQAVRKYAPLFVRRRLRLTYEGTSVQVLTDEKWLSFILEQLLDNAVKYTPAGGVTITVTEEKLVRIADTGIGIDPADLPRIFEKGFTGCNGRTDKAATGLGLYLCRRAAGMLHHRLWASSAPDKGSVFFLDLRETPLEVE